MLSEDIRRPFREYAPAEQVPLLGYVMAIAVYAVGFSFALGVARRKRAQPGWTDVALLGVATHKLSRIITKDFVTAPLRAPFTRRQEAEGVAEVHDEPRGGALRKSVGYLFTCPYCLGVWISTGLNVLLLLRPAQTHFALRTLASVTLSDFLHLSYSRLNESRKTVTAQRRNAEQRAELAVRSGRLDHAVGP
jgi:hypothetical protein